MLHDVDVDVCCGWLTLQKTRLYGEVGTHTHLSRDHTAVGFRRLGARHGSAPHMLAGGQSQIRGFPGPSHHHLQHATSSCAGIRPRNILAAGILPVRRPVGDPPRSRLWLCGRGAHTRTCDHTAYAQTPSRHVTLWEVGMALGGPDTGLHTRVASN